MVVSLRKKRPAVLPYRLAIWSVVGLVVFGFRLQERPITAPGEMELSDGVEITRRSEADILVVLDYDAIRQSGPTFREKDWSASWINLVEQEVGPVSIATPETLSQQEVDEAQVIILTASVSAALPEALIETTRRHALEGKTLVIERPEGRAREIFSARGDAGTRRGRAITHAEGLSPPYVDELRQMPVFTDYIGSTAPREGATTLLSIDGAPVIYALPFGEGQVITVEFNLGEQLVSLQQGRPQPDFTLGSQPNSQRTPRTDDLVADAGLRQNPVPYADLLERFIVYSVLMHHAPLPAFWLFPGGASGAVIFVHEDARLGDGGAWMLEQEVEFGGASTLLTTVDSGLTREGAERIHNKGGEIGLAWRLPDPSTALYERRGIGAFEPLRKPLSLESQLEDLRQRLPVNYLRTARTIDGVWSSAWSEPLSALAAAGIRADFSYETPNQRGYAFGTGLPFLAMNHEGLPLGIREYPVIVPARALQGPATQELLALSAAGHHQLITIGTRPAYFADFPDRREFNAWLQTFEDIQTHDHLIVNALRFDTFQRRRRASSIRSRLIRRASLPEEARTAQTGPDHRGDLLRISAEAELRGMHLVVPARIGDRDFVMARSGARRVGSEVVSQEVETEEASLVGYPLRRLVLEQGFNSLEIFYR